MVKKDRTGKASPADIRIMVSESEKWRKEMHDAIKREHWKQAIGNGCRAIINRANAVTAMRTAEYYKGQDHGRAAGYLEDVLGKEAKGPARQMQLVVKMKQNADYGLTPNTRDEALDVAKRVDRFFSWAERFKI